MADPSNLESPTPSKGSSRRWRFIFAALLFLAALAAAVAAKTQFGFGCTGICAIQTCTPASPCTFKTKTYTAGTICAPPGEGSVCDPGILFDCYCITAINIKTGIPNCKCR